MLLFKPSRTRMFRKRRFALRHAVLSVLVAGAIYAMIPGKDTPTEDSPVVLADIDVSADIMPVNSAVAPVAPVATAAVTAPSHTYEVLNMKDAFDAKPTAPGMQFAQTDEAAAPKPKAVAAPVIESASLSSQISHIQSGITRILEGTGNGLKEILDQKKQLRVGKGDTLMELLVKNEVPRDEAYSAIQALRKVYDPRDLNPAHQVTVFFHKDPAIADPKFVGLRIERDMVNTLIVNRGNDGIFKVNAEAKAVHKEIKAFRGKIDSSLYVDAKEAGVPDAIILELIKMYSWGVDFQREIQGGDEFDVMYEQYVTDDGRIVPNRGEIVYARLGLSERMLPLYRFEDARGDVEYFDPTGASAKKPLMKTPIDGARIASKFGMRRHPVLGYNKMHKGIDFAAPRGTPIYAAGDGVVEKAGRFSSYGNYVRIRHRAGLQTAYAHLNAFKGGVKAGSRVKQGQVIGYVGTTGRSTGPHLHYEILMAGKQVNPASVKLAGGRTLAGKELKAFKALVGERDKSFVSALGPAAEAVAIAEIAPGKSN